MFNENTFKQARNPDINSLSGDASNPKQISTSDVNVLYTTRVMSLVKRWERVETTEFDYTLATLLVFGDWLKTKLRPTLAPESWRAYRYQCVQVFPYEEFISLIDVPPATRKRDKQKRTSAARPRHLKPLIAQILFDHLRQSKSPNAQALMDLITITIGTGLRPSEWSSAKLIDHHGEPALEVQSAQKGVVHSQNKRAIRFIPLSHFDAKEHEALTRFFQAKHKAKSKYADYGAFYTALRELLKRSTRIAFKQDTPRPSLYSARHQFAANLKASDVDPNIIAKVLGHTDITLQTHYYGRTVNGRPIPFNSELADHLNS